ncbi:MAG: zonular occludens toxin domain-containing protein [Nanoarchaeota archaeon]|nr:zonular occludens toxin domain-containing protein [Nanoarchaeota archaeon]
MPNKKREAKKSNNEGIRFAKNFGRTFVQVLKSPYYLAKGITYLTKRSEDISKEQAISKKRESMEAHYEPFKVVETISGDYKKWFSKMLSSDSQIGIIIGARGSGKTAFGIKFLENIYANEKKKCFAIGFKENELPSWINGVSDISQLENDSYVLIDEGGILFNSRSSMSNANKMLSELIMISRHKNLTILFISQNSSNLEVNILRQADFLVLKCSSLLQKEFERKIIQKMYEDSEKYFKKHEDDKGLTYIFAGSFKGFISNSLPSFWREGISKGFRR